MSIVAVVRRAVDGAIRLAQPLNSSSGVAQVASSPTSASRRTCQTVCSRVVVSIPPRAGSRRPGASIGVTSRCQVTGKPGARLPRPAAPGRWPVGLRLVGHEVAVLGRDHLVEHALGAVVARARAVKDRRLEVGRSAVEIGGPVVLQALPVDVHPTAHDAEAAGPVRYDLGTRPAVSRGTTARPMVSTVPARIRRRRRSARVRSSRRRERRGPAAGARRHSRAARRSCPGCSHRSSAVLPQVS